MPYAPQPQPRQDDAEVARIAAEAIALAFGKPVAEELPKPVAKTVAKKLTYEDEAAALAAAGAAAAAAAAAAKKEAEVEVPETADVELVSLEDADAEATGKKVEGDAVEGDDDLEVEETEEAPFIEEQEEGDDDVTDIIGEGREDEEET